MPHRDAKEHDMIGVINGSCLQEGRLNFTRTVRDKDEPGATPDLGGRVDGQPDPVVPVIPTIEHDRHAGRPQRHSGIHVVGLNGSVHKHI
jgi:hypothetical protein